jgi:hypothetical protein
MSAIFPKKYRDKIEDIMESLDSMDTEGLKKKILEAEKNIYEIVEAKSADEELMKAREHAKELGASYRDSKNIEFAKIQYCLYLLENRGISL